MALAVLTVAGRTYRVGCDDGQEARLEELAAILDAKIAQLRSNFGEIGDQRLQVMAALEFADEAADLRAKAETLEKNLAEVEAELQARARREGATEARLTAQVDAMAQRLERLLRELSSENEESDALP